MHLCIESVVLCHCFLYNIIIIMNHHVLPIIELLRHEDNKFFNHVIGQNSKSANF